MTTVFPSPIWAQRLAAGRSMSGVHQGALHGALGGVGRPGRDAPPPSRASDD
ncbi:MAG: hypothetical protein KA217_02590 [Gammaproteobacteria bacterium]|nr:hypothetical protein [Gammaproteobacteria bacterium]